jgi:hypothetical protein
MLGQMPYANPESNGKNKNKRGGLSTARRTMKLSAASVEMTHLLRRKENKQK